MSRFFSLTETSGFLGPHPNTVVKLDQKEILVNYKASILLDFMSIYVMVKQW